jgi:hypothetical protein
MHQLVDYKSTKVDNLLAEFGLILCELAIAEIPQPRGTSDLECGRTHRKLDTSRLLSIGISIRVGLRVNKCVIHRRGSDRPIQWRILVREQRTAER